MERKKPKAQKPPVSKVKANSNTKVDSHTKTDPDALAKLAYHLFQRRGSGHGHDIEDWLMAEQMLQEKKKRRGTGRNT